MAVHHRLEMLSDAMRRADVPAGRTVVMAARLSPAVGIGTRDLRPLDDGARVGGGRILPISITQPNALEVVTWNTGEASDLRKVGNRSHAEAQFFEFIRDRTFDSIEIEISHSPCTACIDMLAGWLRKRMESGTTFSKPTIRNVGNRTYVGSPGRNLPNVPAVIRWGVLYDMPPQATTWQYLSDLHKAGWQLAAPGNALPGGTGSTPVHLL